MAREGLSDKAIFELNLKKRRQLYKELRMEHAGQREQQVQRPCARYTREAERIPVQTANEGVVG